MLNLTPSNLQDLMELSVTDGMTAKEFVKMALQLPEDGSFCTPAGRLQCITEWAMFLDGKLQTCSCCCHDDD